MKDKKLIFIIILSVLTLALLATAAFLFFKFNDSKKTNTTIMEENQKKDEEMEYLIELGNQELRNNLNVAHEQYNELLAKIDNDSLKFKLERERDRTQALIDELERTKATSTAEIRRLNKEIERLRATQRDYIRQIDELSRENETLKQENTDVKEKYMNATKQIDNLSSEKEQLSEKVAIASQLDAKDIRIRLLNKRNKETSKLKDAKKIWISFNIAKNVTSTTGDKTVYARILQPGAELLSKSESNTFAYENKNIQYSIKRSFEYSGEETSIEMFWDIEESIQKGEYSVYLFVDGNMIGEGKATLK